LLFKIDCVHHNDILTIYSRYIATSKVSGGEKHMQIEKCK